MTDPEATDVAVQAAKYGGSTGAGMLLFAFIQRVFKKEDADEARTQAQLQDIQRSLTALSGRFDVFLERQSAHAGEILELKERVAGMSTNYGKRIGELEIAFARLEAKMEAKMEVK